MSSIQSVNKESYLTSATNTIRTGRSAQDSIASIAKDSFSQRSLNSSPIGFANRTRSTQVMSKENGLFSPIVCEEQKSSTIQDDSPCAPFSSKQSDPTSSSAQSPGPLQSNSPCVLFPPVQSPNSLLEEWKTACHYMRSGDMERLKEALQNPQILSFLDEKGNHLLLLAIKARNLEAVDLLASMTNFRTEGIGKSSLFFTIEFDLFEEAELLIDAIKKTEAFFFSHFSLLQCAIKNNATNCFQLLLKMGVNPDSREHSDGSTALMYALHQEKNSFVFLLVKYGANLDIQNTQGRTALMIAAQTKNYQGIELLKNANPYCKTIYKQTVFSFISDPRLSLQILRSYHSFGKTHIFYQSPDIPKRSVAIRTKNSLTQRTLLLLFSPSGQLIRSYEQIKLSAEEKRARPRGSYKICKPILYNHQANTSVRLVSLFNTFHQGSIPEIFHFWETQSSLQKYFQNQRGLAKADLIVLTMNKRAELTVDIYQKKHALGTLKKIQKLSLPVATKLKFSLDILYGLHALHSANIAHCDVKLDNVLVDKEEAVLTDFDQVAFSDSGSIPRGTPKYLSPELAEKMLTHKNVKNREEFIKADIWAMGLTLYRFWSGGFPVRFDETKINTSSWQECLMYLCSLKSSEQNILPTPPPSDRFRDILWKMLQVDPEKRPGSEHILNVFRTLTPMEISHYISQNIDDFNFA